MEFVLKTVKSLAPELDKSHCFCIPKYLRYEESAKLCLCENEYRKLKNYVGYYKFLELNKIYDEIIYEHYKIDQKQIEINNALAEKNSTIAMLQIIKIEDTLEYFNSRKIAINSSDTEFNDKVKLLKKTNPIIFGMTLVTRMEIENSNVKREYMQDHLDEIISDHIFNLNLDNVKRKKKARELAEIYQFHF